MKIYVKGKDYATFKVDETWVETEDEIVETPIGTQLQSYTQTMEYQQRINKLQKQRRLDELLELLKSTDYIGIKIATGRATVEDYADEIQQMNAWAAEVDKIREELKDDSNN